MGCSGLWPAVGNNKFEKKKKEKSKEKNKGIKSTRNPETRNEKMNTRKRKNLHTTATNWEFSG
jgi:hypothetical protein